MLKPIPKELLRELNARKVVPQKGNKEVHKHFVALYFGSFLCGFLWKGEVKGK